MSAIHLILLERVWLFTNLEALFQFQGSKNILLGTSTEIFLPTRAADSALALPPSTRHSSHYESFLSGLGLDPMSLAMSPSSRLGTTHSLGDRLERLWILSFTTCYDIARLFASEAPLRSFALSVATGHDSILTLFFLCVAIGCCRRQVLGSQRSVGRPTLSQVGLWLIGERKVLLEGDFKEHFQPSAMS